MHELFIFYFKINVFFIAFWPLLGSANISFRTFNVSEGELLEEKKSFHSFFYS